MLDFVDASAAHTKTTSKYHSQIQNLLSNADIAAVTEVQRATRPWDMQVHNPALFGRILGEGSLGLGEAYMEGWWDCEHLDEFFHRVITANLSNAIGNWSQRLALIVSYLRNMQIGRRLEATGAEPYDIGNDLYAAMLDPRMIYSCGYWKNASSLKQAQEHKLELVARKLRLQPGMRILDIGCGWGGSADYMAAVHGVDVVGITLSEQQFDHAQQHYASSTVEFRRQDFRALDQRFDRVYSIGMFEHVGFKNYPDYFRVVDRCLEPDGLFLLHTIGHHVTSYRVDPWMNKYIFPNSILPSEALIRRHTAGTFVEQDWHNFGYDYHTTLLAWEQNCRTFWGQNSAYDERFRRMWRYFLMCSAGAFKAGHNQLWQIVLSKQPLEESYRPVRSAL